MIYCLRNKYCKLHYMIGSNRDRQGTGRDSPVIFVPVPLVPRDNYAGHSRENLSQSRSSRRLLSRSRSRGSAGRDRDPDIGPGQPPIPGLKPDADNFQAHELL